MTDMDKLREALDALIRFAYGDGCVGKRPGTGNSGVPLWRGTVETLFSDLIRERDERTNAVAIMEALNKRLNTALADITAQRDTLMLEHCPDQMTRKQVIEWEKHQVPAPKHAAQARRVPDELALAALIHSYNADAPHRTVDEYYPEITPYTMRMWLLQIHDGDCTKQCHACLRCQAEESLHMARWIISKLGAPQPPAQEQEGEGKGE